MTAGVGPARTENPETAARATAVERALARVDTGAVERNCALLKRALGDAALCAVVKANGYGHGALACARAALAGGATWLAVATAAEAAELRADGVEGRILVMGALTEPELVVALEASADVVAWTRSFVELAGARALDVGRAARIHAKVDTGMGRLGTRDGDEALAILDRAAAGEPLEAAGLMTHFATADEPRSEYLAEQLSRFAPIAAEVKRSHPAIVVHAANSAAVLAEPESHYDMARCGIAVYGLDPFQRDPHEQGLEPALSLESYVAAVKPFAPGESAGYGRSWAATRKTCVGVLPIGYGDGYRRGLSNAADVLIRGRRYPLVGTISMDNVTVDLGPDTDVRVGERAMLIGRDGAERILAEDLARALSTINYEVTCGLSGRVRRLYGEGARSEP